jgi:hypothetical protein
MTEAAPPRAVVAVRDLFWSARIRETARLAARPLSIVRTPDELRAALEEAPAALAIVDLTTPGWDYDALLAVVEASRPRPPVLGFTTHALARQTQPYHARCDRVVTKETLTRELGEIMRHGQPDGHPPMPESSRRGKETTP